jgi:Notch-like protein
VQKCIKDATTSTWALTCTGEVLPKSEVCDLIDNDCNGTTDDVTGVGNTCCQFQDKTGTDLCGTGICTSGTLACVSGKSAPQCTKGVGPVPELCDGLDNNCNGVTDDLPGGTVGGECCPSGACGIGVCTKGHLQCGPGGIICGGAVNKTGETCDGLDNDCNGITDDVPGLGTKCCPSGHCGTGICTSGTLACTKSGPTGQETYQLLCAGGQDAITETCNGADDNCNGITDDVPGVGESCCPAGSPAGAAPAACNKGVCRPGVTKCDAASQATICVGGHGPDANACDGRDNNCDGAIDEAAEIANDPLIGVVCDAPTPPADHLPCKAGLTICQGNKPVCSGQVGPTAETCNGFDDNCDGITDGQAPCATGDSCIAGACRAPCSGGEFAHCPGGLACVNNFCVPPDSSGAGGAGNGTAGSGNAGSGNAGSGNAGSGNAGSGNAGSGNAGSGNAGGAGNGTDAGSGASGNGSGAAGNGSGASGKGSGASGNGSGASGNGSGASGNGSGASGNGSGASGNGSGASGNGSGASGNGSGAANGTGASPGSGGRRQYYGLATGGGGCACRAGGGESSPVQGVSLAALIGLGLVARRRNRRAA